MTERHLKNRIGECVNCYECCKYTNGDLCNHIDLENKRCKVYNNRTCDEWFPVSQKEIDCMATYKIGFKCKFSFK